VKRRTEREKGKLDGALTADTDEEEQTDSAANRGGGQLGLHTGDDVPADLPRRRSRLVDAKLVEVAAPSIGVPSLRIEQRPAASSALWLGHGSAAALCRWRRNAQGEG
jgi:hypothetical protein